MLRVRKVLIRQIWLATWGSCDGIFESLIFPIASSVEQPSSKPSDRVPVDHSHAAGVGMGVREELILADLPESEAASGLHRLLFHRATSPRPVAPHVLAGKLFGRQAYRSVAPR